MHKSYQEKTVIITICVIIVFVIGGFIITPIIVSDKLSVKWLAIGDSITFGEDDNALSYADYLAEEHSNISLNKISWGGLRIEDLIRLAESGFTNDDDDIDIVTVLIGANDFGFDTPIASFENDIDTYMKILKDNFPDARIIFLTPLYRDYFGNTIPTMGGTINNLGVSLYQYSDVIAAQAQKNDIEVINLTDDDFLSDDNIRIYTSDGLHPNVAGNKMIADKLYKIIDFYDTQK